MAFRKQKTVNDLGFGTAGNGNNRNMNKDGSFNVERTGEPLFRSYEIYHSLITMTWTKFFVLVLSGYFIVNILFAFVYFSIGAENLSIEGIEKMTDGEKFAEVFFFSSQTLTTLGYGRIAPIGTMASSVASIESMIGLLGFALATGILYGRFSRPQAKLLYSENAVIAPYREGTGLMFRMANMRRNQLIEVEADVNVGFNHPETKARSFAALNLERKKIALFPTSWTLVHPIDEESPFYGKSSDELEKMNIEIFVLLKAYDDTFSQTVYSRTSYRATEIKYGAKFLPMFSQQSNGKTLLDLRLINAMETVKLPALNVQIDQSETKQIN
jgi:inward rectifier potassium channel